MTQMLKEVDMFWLIIPPKPNKCVMLSAAKHLPKPLIFRHLTQILHCVQDIAKNHARYLPTVIRYIPPKPLLSPHQKHPLMHLALEYAN
jgi:hypothetical protein